MGQQFLPSSTESSPGLPQSLGASGVSGVMASLLPGCQASSGFVFTSPPSAIPSVSASSNSVHSTHTNFARVGEFSLTELARPCCASGAPGLSGHSGLSGPRGQQSTGPSYRLSHSYSAQDASSLIHQQKQYQQQHQLHQPNCAFQPATPKLRYSSHHIHPAQQQGPLSHPPLPLPLHTAHVAHGQPLPQHLAYAALSQPHPGLCNASNLISGCSTPSQSRLGQLPPASGQRPNLMLNPLSPSTTAGTGLSGVAAPLATSGVTTGVAPIPGPAGPRSASSARMLATPASGSGPPVGPSCQPASGFVGSSLAAGPPASSVPGVTAPTASPSSSPAGPGLLLLPRPGGDMQVESNGPVLPGLVGPPSAGLCRFIPGHPGRFYANGEMASAAAASLLWPG
ncbi:unnamed protein product [Protopolystoma xenopodis]|uniref:Uncharacterized protein n=1 Tax=Protopolystoma xenopodis TaxID=117903 RepID=A0A3S4ZCC6_9PLAT|nr:unnamed protein product [Protopolystoma xenopodis]